MKGRLDLDQERRLGSNGNQNVTLADISVGQWRCWIYGITAPKNRCEQSPRKNEI